MRLLAILGCLICGGCTADAFVPDDGGVDSGGGGDAGNVDGGGSVDGTGGSDGKPQDVVAIKDGIGVGDVISWEASSPASIQCNQANTSPCTPLAQVCCGTQDWGSSSCVASSGCTTAGSYPLGCDDATDCPSGVCCAAVTTTSSYFVMSSMCRTACISTEIQLCRVSAECLVTSKTCKPLLSGSSPPWLDGCQ